MCGPEPCGDCQDCRDCQNVTTDESYLNYEGYASRRCFVSMCEDTLTERVFYDHGAIGLPPRPVWLCTEHGGAVAWAARLLRSGWA